MTHMRLLKRRFQPPLYQLVDWISPLSADGMLTQSHQLHAIAECSILVRVAQSDSRRVALTTVALNVCKFSCASGKLFSLNRVVGILRRLNLFIQFSLQKLFIHQG